MDDHLSYPYWAGRLSEVLRQVLEGTVTEDLAAETLAGFDAWCENRQRQTRAVEGQS